MMQVVWIPANGAMLILFLSIFVPHFENIFIHFPNARQEQRNKRIFWLLFYHMLHCCTYGHGLRSIPLSPKCHNNYHVEMQTKKLKCCQWKYLYSSLKFGMNSFYQKQLSEWAMGDPTKKMCPFLLPFICIGSGGQTLVWNFPHFFWRVPLDSIRYDLMEIYCVLVSNFIFFEVY